MVRIVKQLTRRGLYTPETVKDVEEVCACLAKFMLYNYTIICSFKKEVLADTLCNLTLGIGKYDKVKGSSGREDECREMLVDTIASFKKIFKGLNNLTKFTDKKVLETIEQSLY